MKCGDARRDLGRRDDSLIGQRTKIRSGAFRGYRGKVVDATDSVVRVELEALTRTVTVKRSDVEAAAMVPPPPPPLVRPLRRPRTPPSRGAFPVGRHTPLSWLELSRFAADARCVAMAAAVAALAAAAAAWAAA